MKKVLACTLAMCLCVALLAGCGPKNSADTSGNGAVSEEVAGSSSESENPPVEISNPHGSIISSTFELDGVRFWHHDDIEMECDVIEDIKLAEITLDGVMLHVQVDDQDNQSSWFDGIVRNGVRGASTSGDLCYQVINDDMWEVATDSGKLIVLLGDKGSGDDWKSIAQKIEWTIIGSSETTNVAGTEETFNLEYDGINYGIITVSGFLSSDRSEFNLGNGDIRNWSYKNVSAGGICTVTPSDVSKYTVITLTAWKEENGEYSPTRYELSPWHRLYADGQASDLTFADELEYMPLPTSEHPAQFIFGGNMDVKSPFGSETCSFVLKADGTLYRLDIDFYDESGKCVDSFIWPFFVH